MTNNSIPQNDTMEITQTLTDETFLDCCKQLPQFEQIQGFIEGKNQQLNTFKKQALDMRRKLSKGNVIPEDIASYQDAYTPEENFIPFYKDENHPMAEFVSKTSEAMNQLAFDNGLTLTQANAVKNAFNAFMQEIGVFDTRTQEQKIHDQKLWREEQKKLIGENSEDIIQENVDFYKHFQQLEEQDSQFVLNLMNQGALAVNFFDKIRKLIQGNRIGDDIPNICTQDDFIPDDNTLVKEYNHPDTSMERRLQIIQQRINSGRNHKFPFHPV